MFSRAEESELEVGPDGHQDVTCKAGIKRIGHQDAVCAGGICVRIGVGPIQAVKPTFSATAGPRDGGVPSQARAGCPFAAAHSGKVKQAPVWHSHCRRPDYFLEQYTASVSTGSWERGHTPRGDSLYKEESPEVQTPGKKVLKKSWNDSNASIHRPIERSRQALPSERVGSGKGAPKHQTDNPSKVNRSTSQKDIASNDHGLSTAGCLVPQVQMTQVPTPKRLRGRKSRTVVLSIMEKVHQ